MKIVEIIASIVLGSLLLAMFVLGLLVVLYIASEMYQWIEENIENIKANRKKRKKNKTK